MKYLWLLILAVTTSSVWALEVGDNAPNIVGRQSGGGLFSLSRAPAKPKVVNFFWVECKPCREELPLLAKKQKAFPNIEFYAVHAESDPATSRNYNLSAVEDFVGQLEQVPSTVVLGSPRLKTSYDIEAMPHTVLLDENNQVVEILKGYNEDTMKRLQAWLSSY